MCLLSLKVLHLSPMHLISFPAACCPASLNAALFDTEQSILQRPSLPTNKYHFFLVFKEQRNNSSSNNKTNENANTRPRHYSLICYPFELHREKSRVSPPELFTRDPKFGGHKNWEINLKRKCKYKVSILWQNSLTTSLAISRFHLTVCSDPCQWSWVE